MRRAIQALASITLAGILVVVGVLAATSAKHTTSPSVTFKSNNAAVSITGQLYRSCETDSMKVYNPAFTTATHEGGSVKAADPWYLTDDMQSGSSPAIVFTLGIPAYIITFEFTNYGSRAVTIDFDRETNNSLKLTKPATVNFSYTFTQQVGNGTPTTITQATLDASSTAQRPTLRGLESAAAGADKVTLRILLSLTDGNTAITPGGANNFSFNLVFTAKAPTT